MAARVEREPDFVAYALTAYRRLEGLNAAGLAAYLGCPEPALARLALSGRPEGDDPMFADRVRRIAGYAGCEPAKLANLLRAVELTERTKPAAPSALLAARDRISEEPSDYDETPPSQPVPGEEPRA
jgi:hypothetical protein